MAVEAPARIAILGAGPIGLEAALYARYLGYETTVFERGSVAQHVSQWGHVTMFTPFAMNCSTLGRAAINSHLPTSALPADDCVTSGASWVESYLAPLAKTDLVVDSLRLQTTVEFIGRAGTLKTESPGAVHRGAVPFHLLLRGADGKQSRETAEIVIDTTGTYANHNWLGPGGIPAIGEVGCSAQIEYHVPDIRNNASDRYAGKHTLLIGAGYSAATTAVLLAELAREVPGTRVTWITRRRGERSTCECPIRQIVDDRLPHRYRLTADANQLIHQAGFLEYWPETMLLNVSWDDTRRQFVVMVDREHGGEYTFDRLIANVGYRPDRELYRELHMHECYSSEAPMKLAAAMLLHTTHDCLEQTSHGADNLLNPEPNFFILGSKSHGRGSQFLFQSGLAQIRDAFSIIAGRHDLDLYETMKK